MFIQQTDLFRGMSKEFVKKVYDTAVKESFEKDVVLFLEGDKAEHFYILLKGRVKLAVGEIRQLVHVVEHPGEAFGWSSLVGRTYYSASAECKEATKLIKIEAKKLLKVLENDPANGIMFFNVAGTALGILSTMGGIGSILIIWVTGIVSHVITSILAAAGACLVSDWVNLSSELIGPSTSIST